MTLGERIQFERERRMLTQNELARRSGVPQSTISRLETGDVSDLRFEPIVKIARVLGLSIDSLASGEDLQADLGRVITDEHARTLLRLFDGLSITSRELLLRFAQFLNVDDQKLRERVDLIREGQIATDLTAGSMARARGLAASVARREPLGLPPTPLGLPPLTDTHAAARLAAKRESSEFARRRMEEEK